MTALIQHGRVIQDPPFIRSLFNNPRSAYLWLALRLWLGYQWIEAALQKIENPAWIQTGNALKDFWFSAVQIPADGQPPITSDWYRSFIQFMLDAKAFTWLGKLVAFGELIVGIALILGAFTGIAAFFGALMNWNFMMAGSASSNPFLFVIALGVVMAWKIAGYIGLDYFLLPWIGTPWDRKVRDRSSIASTETKKT
jgi:thiosulfate dehydrogenase [quinone] large subunit